MTADKPMKIVSWNVNSIRARLPHVLDYLRLELPDVLLLQETKTVNETFPQEAIEDMGYSCCIFGQKSYNGVAILAKGNIEDPVYGLPGFDDPQARYLEAYIDGRIKVASIYVPNGEEVGAEKYAYKLRFLEALNAHVDTLLLDATPWAMGGDFNIAPGDADVYDAKLWHDGRILCSPPERGAFRQLLHKGLTDGLRHCHPVNTEAGHDLFTWWNYRTRGWENGQGLRIDHFLLSPQAADILTDAGVHTTPRSWVRPSDHAPIWVDVRR